MYFLFTGRRRRRRVKDGQFVHVTSVAKEPTFQWVATLIRLVGQLQVAFLAVVAVNVKIPRRKIG